MGARLTKWRPKFTRCPVCCDFKWSPRWRKSTDPASILALAESAKSGCVTCRILQEVIQSFQSPSGSKAEYLTVTGVRNQTRSSGTRPTRPTYLWAGKNEPGKMDWVQYWRQEYKMYSPQLEIHTLDGSKLNIILYRSPGKKIRPHLSELELIVDEGNPCPWPAIRLRAPDWTDDTASEACHSWAVDQMHRCLSHHEKCRAEPDNIIPALPTRVLDLGSGLAADDTIILLETCGLRGQYVALSHCWGDPKLMPTKLTAHTKETYKSAGVDFNSLPKTFQHAVTFTRKLGIRYLWIDSLCIIQSDPEKDSELDFELSFVDWLSEASRMCDVYRNAHLTLAALSSTSCTGGLFFRPAVDIKGRTHSWRRFHISARKTISHDSRQFPLMKRGWVAQEYILSPRTLLFGEHELLWSCIEHTTCQCSSDTQVSGFGLSLAYSKLPRISDSQVQVSRRHDNFDAAQKWRSIMADYSNTSLSQRSDRLAAVEGIAQYMRQWRGRECKYLKGLWSDSLPFDLIWRKLEPERLSPDQPKDLFPTWSWASVKGMVSWQSITMQVSDGIFVKYLGHVGSTTTSYPGSLRLFLSGFPVIISPRYRFEESEFNGHMVTGGLYYPDQDRDKELVANSTETYYWLKVLDSGQTCYSLVLRCKDEENRVYDRVGMLRFDSLSQVKHGEEVAVRGVYYRLYDRCSGRYQVGTPWWVFRNDLASDPVTFSLI